MIEIATAFPRSQIHRQVPPFIAQAARIRTGNVTWHGNVGLPGIALGFAEREIKVLGEARKMAAGASGTCRDRRQDARIIRFHG
jgi:hypothetical protein